MRRVKKVNANFNILKNVEDFDLLVLKFITTFRSKSKDGLKLLVVCKDPISLSELASFTGYTNISFIDLKMLRTEINNDIYPRIFVHNFDVGDIKSISIVIDICYRKNYDIELFFNENNNESILEIISKYLFLFKKVNVNLYTNEHFKDMFLDGSWKFSPTTGAVRK